MEYNSINIARYYYEKNNLLTDKQLQKLVYYAYCWYMVKKNNFYNNNMQRLFNEQPEAWMHGPVFPALYKETTYNKEAFKKNDDFKNMSFEVIQLLDTIYEVYGQYSGNELENLTHNELPWIEARGNLQDYESSSQKIKDKTIFEFYSS